MTAPCPTLGFSVEIELAADADGTRELWGAWTAMLEERGLCCARRGGPGRFDCAVTSEASQATENDRVAVRAWLDARVEARRVVVGPIEDLSRAS